MPSCIQIRLHHKPITCIDVDTCIIQVEGETSFASTVSSSCTNRCRRRQISTHLVCSTRGQNTSTCSKLSCLGKTVLQALMSRQAPFPSSKPLAQTHCLPVASAAPPSMSMHSAFNEHGANSPWSKHQNRDLMHTLTSIHVFTNVAIQYFA